MSRVRNTLLNWGLLVFFSLFGVGVFEAVHVMFPENDLLKYMVPNPGALSDQLFTNFHEWSIASFETVKFSAFAMFFSVVIGIAIGGMAAYLKLWIFDKICQLIWSVPLIAIAVYLQLLVGLTSYFYISLGAFLGFYPIAKHTFEECRRHHEGIMALRVSFSMSKFSEFLHFRWPLVLSRMRAAIASTVTLCIVGVTMAEYFVGSSGLGGKLKGFGNKYNYDYLWCNLLLLMFLVFFSSKIVEFFWDFTFPRSCRNEEEIF